MNSSYPLSLFSGPPPREGAPSAAVVSLVLHAVLLAMILAGTVRVRVVHQQDELNDTARMIDLRKPSPDIQYHPPKNLLRHAAPAPHAPVSGGAPQQAHAARVTRVSRNFKTSLPAPQTLIQPDVPQETHTLLPIPVPQAVVWTPGKVVLRKIVTPAPVPLAAIQVRPTLAIPNQELRPSDVPLTATRFTTDAPIPQPGTTTPMDVIAQQQAQRVPMTASQQAAQLSPARVLSISSLKLANGSEALPAINEIAAAQMTGSPSEGVSAGSSPNGGDASGSGGNGGGSGQGNGNGESSAGAAPAQHPASGPGYTVTGGDDTGTLTPDSESAAHITLSPIGQYGMVVVGASPQEEYPEVRDLWKGRLVYTVYLRTNTAQSWILQYSQPRRAADPPDDPSGQADGVPSAPWAFNIMRPSLGSYSGAVLVHGFITPEGRFAGLSVVFPPNFSMANLLLRALKLWQFRPAMVNGQPITVETLLVIPGSQG